MKRKKTRLSALSSISIALLTFSSCVYAASFDCLKAKSVNERLICDDGELSKLDDQLALAYKEALRKSSNTKELVANQREAWRHREKECSSKKCLTEWFAQRQAFFSPVSSQLPVQLPSPYLPWTLDVSGFKSGNCEESELARSFKEARGWASENSGWVNVRSIVESPEKISISYYDGLLRAESVRTFYVDMKTCKAFRK